jgi:hypothetical protein
LRHERIIADRQAAGRPRCEHVSVSCGSLTAFAHPVRMPRDANIVEPYRGIVAPGLLHGNAFNDDPSATRRSPQRIAQQFRRSRGVIEQTDLAKIRRLGQVKSKKLVRQRQDSGMQSGFGTQAARRHPRSAPLSALPSSTAASTRCLPASLACVRAA